MAQVIAIVRPAAAYFGVEAGGGAYAVTPGMTRCFPVHGTLKLAPDQAELTVDELRAELYDNIAPVKGLQGGTVEWTAYLRADATQKTHLTTATRTWLGMMLLCAFGGEFPADTTANCSGVVASGTASSVTLAAGGGAKFAKGQVALFPSGALYEPSPIVQIATDVLTPNPVLSASPTATDMVNPWNYFPTQATPPSFTMQFLLAGANSATRQWTLNGCVMQSVELKLERGAIPTITFKAKIGRWVGPSNQSLVATTVANPMGLPWRFADVVSLLQPVATTTRVQNRIMSVAVKFNLGLDFVEELGGTEGKSGGLRKGERVFCEATILQPPDDAYGASNQDADLWGGRVPLQLLFAAPQGAGATKRWMGFYMGTGVIVGKPKPNFSKGYELAEFVLQSLITTAVTTPNLANPIERAPGVLFVD